MMSRYRNILTALLITTTLILGACADSGASANIDLNSYPESVQNGTVSEEFFTYIRDFAEKSHSYSIDISSMLNDRESIEEMTLLLEAFDVILEDFERVSHPTTETDKEINSVVSDYVEQQMKINGLNRAIANDNGHIYFNAKELMDDWLIKEKNMTNVMKRYGIQ